MFLESVFQSSSSQVLVETTFIILVGDSLSGLGALAYELLEFHSRLGPQVYQQPHHVRVELMIVETCSTAKVM